MTLDPETSVECWRDLCLSAEAERDALKAEVERLKAALESAASQHYCKMCGETLDGYVPPSGGEEKG